MIYYFAFLFFLPIFLAADEEPSPAKKTICLNMIVKDEKKVITRCLNSLKPLIDYWVIVDTGSTDGTQNLIKECMKDIPGELYERPWVNFEHNRNEALKLAQGKSDYLLLIDADEEAIFPPSFTFSTLDKDYYFIQFVDPSSQMNFCRICLLNMRCDWQWVGVVHEQLKSNSSKTKATMPDIFYQIDTASSARSQDPLKYQKDAQLLEEALAKDPDNSRYVFYLAQSYSHAKEYKRALENYQKRSTMGGWDQEVFWSLLMSAKLQDFLEYPSDTVLQSYSKAYQYCPHRAEPLFYLTEYLIKRGQILLAYSLAQVGSKLSLPLEEGYVEPNIYEYGVRYLLAATACELGKYEEALPILQQLVAEKKFPAALEDPIFSYVNRCLISATKNREDLKNGTSFLHKTHEQ